MTHFWNFMHRLLRRLGRFADRLRHYGVDVPVVILSIALVLVGSLYYLDRQRWNDYLDCQDASAAALVPRSVASAEYSKANTTDNIAQADLVDALHSIAVSIPLDGKPPTAREQREATQAYLDLGPASAEASRTSDALVAAQEHLAKVQAANPLPECGSVPE